MKLADEQLKEIRNRHDGGGVIIIKKNWNTITTANIHFGKNGHFYAGDCELHKYISELAQEMKTQQEGS